MLALFYKLLGDKIYANYSGIETQSIVHFTHKEEYKKAMKNYYKQSMKWLKKGMKISKSKTEITDGEKLIVEIKEKLKFVTRL